MFSGDKLEAEIKKDKLKATEVAASAVVADEKIAEREDTDDEREAPLDDEEKLQIFRAFKARIIEIIKETGSGCDELGVRKQDLTIIIEGLQVKTNNNAKALYDALLACYPNCKKIGADDGLKISWSDLARDAIAVLNQKYVIIRAQQSADGAAVDEPAAEVYEEEEQDIPELPAAKAAMLAPIEPLFSGAFLAEHRNACQSVISVPSAADYPRQRVVKMTTEEQFITGYQLAKVAQGKETLFVVGKSGSGKSTFINWLNRTKYKAAKNELGAEIAIPVTIAGKPMNEVVKVGHSALESETIFPSIVEVQAAGKKLALCDCPGFFDSDGRIEMANRFAVRLAAEFASVVAGIVVVIEYKTLECDGRGESFRSLFKLLSEFFKVNDSLKHSIIFVINRVPPAKTEKEVAGQVAKLCTAFWRPLAAKQQSVLMAEQDSAGGDFEAEPPKLDATIQESLEQFQLMSLMRDRLMIYNIYDQEAGRIWRTREEVIAVLEGLTPIPKTSIAFPLVGISKDAFSGVFHRIAEEGRQLLKRKAELKKEKQELKVRYQQNEELIQTDLAELEAINKSKSGDKPSAALVQNWRKQGDDYAKRIEQLDAEISEIDGDIKENEQEIQKLDKLAETKAIEYVTLDAITATRSSWDVSGMFSWCYIPGATQEVYYNDEASIVLPEEQAKAEGEAKVVKKILTLADAVVVASQEVKEEEKEGWAKWSKKKIKIIPKAIARSTATTHTNLVEPIQHNGKDETGHVHKDVFYRTHYQACYLPPYDSTYTVTISLPLMQAERKKNVEQRALLNQALKEKGEELKKKQADKAKLVAEQAKLNNRIDKAEKGLEVEKNRARLETSLTSRRIIGREILVEDQRLMQAAKDVDRAIIGRMAAFDLVVGIGALRLHFLLFRELFELPSVKCFLQAYKETLLHTRSFKWRQSGAGASVLLAAQTVHIVGDFNDWLKQQPAEADFAYDTRKDEWALVQNQTDPDLWELTVSLAPRIDSYRYQFLINGRTYWPDERQTLVVDSGLSLKIGPQVTPSQTLAATPLHNAVWLGEKALVRRLLAVPGCDVNQVAGPAWHTPLMYAVKGNKLEIVKLLLEEYKASINARDKEGNTAMHHAVLCSYDAIAHLLLTYGANIFLLNNAGHNVIDIAVLKNNRALLKRKLLKPQDLERAFIDLRDGRHEPLLHTAVTEDAAEVLQDLILLLQSKRQILDLNKLLYLVFNQDGDTYLHSAVRKGCKTIVRWLVANGLCPLDKKNADGNSVLHLAVLYADGEMIDILLEKVDRGFPWPYFVGTNKAGQSVFALAEQGVKGKMGGARASTAVKILETLNRHKKQLFLAAIIEKMQKRNLSLPKEAKITLFCRDKYNEFIASDRWRAFLNEAICAVFVAGQEVSFLFQASEKLAAGMVNRIIADKSFDIPKLSEVLKKELIELQQIAQAVKLNEQVSEKANVIIVNPTTIEEKTFVAVLHDFLLSHIFCAVNLLAGEVRRQLTGGDQVKMLLDSISGSCLTAGMQIGKELGASMTPGVLGDIGKHYGLNLAPTTIGTGIGAATGAVVGGGLRLIGYTIGKTIDSSVKKRAECVSVAFEGAQALDGKWLVDIKAAEAICQKMLYCYRDQINQLTEGAVYAFAQYIGQKIIAHISEGRDEYIDDDHPALKLIKQIGRRIDGSNREKTPLLLRCFKALHYQASKEYKDEKSCYKLIRKETAKASGTDSDKSLWYAPRVIIHTGAKRLVQIQGGYVIYYYVSTNDSNQPKHELYGFCSVQAEVEVDFLTNKHKFVSDPLARDIFAKPAAEDTGGACAQVTAATPLYTGRLALTRVRAQAPASDVLGCDSGEDAEISGSLLSSSAALPDCIVASRPLLRQYSAVGLAEGGKGVSDREIHALDTMMHPGIAGSLKERATMFDGFATDNDLKIICGDLMVDSRAVVAGHNIITSIEMARAALRGRIHEILDTCNIKFAAGTMQGEMWAHIPICHQPVHWNLLSVRIIRSTEGTAKIIRFEMTDSLSSVSGGVAQVRDYCSEDTWYDAAFTMQDIACSRQRGNSFCGDYTVQEALRRACWKIVGIATDDSQDGENGIRLREATEALIINAQRKVVGSMSVSA